MSMMALLTSMSITFCLQSFRHSSNSSVNNKLGYRKRCQFLLYRPETHSSQRHRALRHLPRHTSLTLPDVDHHHLLLLLHTVIFFLLLFLLGWPFILHHHSTTASTYELLNRTFDSYQCYFCVYTLLRSLSDLRSEKIRCKLNKFLCT